MLAPEEVVQIKEQILKQIENFPEDKRQAAKEQIETMNAEELEAFLEKNNLIKSDSGKASRECIFCSINSGKIHSHKIDENKTAIAALEINPISRGHVIIIPKKHQSFQKTVPKTLNAFANKIAKKLKLKLKVKKVQLAPANLFGHGIINVIPVYDNETLESQRSHASEEELSKLEEMFKKKPKIPVPRPSKVSKIKPEESKKLWLPRRIP